MKYTLQKNNVIYTIAGRNEFKINVIKGKLWITVEGDPKDLILVDGDSMSLKGSGKIGSRHLTIHIFCLREINSPCLS